MPPRGRPPSRRGQSSRPNPDPPENTNTASVPSSSSAAISEAPQPSQSVSSRPPVQRLDTVKSTVPASFASTSTVAGPSTLQNAAPGSSQAKKPLRSKPRFTARRSKEERDALAAIERERIKERAAAVEAAEKLAAGNDSRGRGQRDRARGGRGGRGRGGYMGAGTFSSGIGVAGASRKTRGAGRPRIPREPEDRGVNIKRENTVKQDEDGDLSMLGIKVKKEQFEGGYLSSDPDDDEGPKQDIDFINLVSSSDEELSMLSEAQKASRNNRGSPMLAPIRIQRREHQLHDPVIKIEEDERPPKSQDSERKNRVHQASSAGDARKGKARTKDVEVLKAEKTWKGVYTDEDSVKIKTEAQEDENVAVDEIPETVPTNDEQDEQSRAKEPPSSPEKTKKDERNVKSRHRKHLFSDTKGMMHTAEDRQEWSRHEESLKVLRDELGQIRLGQPAAATDAEGDVNMDDAAQHDKKSDRVYLFQFPSVMPALRVASDDRNATNDTDTVPETSPSIDPVNAPQAAEATDAPSGQETVKVEQTDADAIEKTEKSSLWPPMASGEVGKLRVYESGRATLSWGGTSFAVAMGTDAHFLQDVVLARMPSGTGQTTGKPGQAPERKGEAMALGQVRGKFVVTPDWSEIIG